MNLRSRNFLVVVSLVLLLCVGGVGMAIASPDGDDDPTYNASGTNGFGTQYSLLEEASDTEGRPIVAVDPSDGSSVTATLTQGRASALRGGGFSSTFVSLTRFDSTGAKTGFGVELSDPLPWFETNSSYRVLDLLDVRVQADGTIRVLVRAEYEPSEVGPTYGELWDLHFASSGTFQPAQSKRYESPDGCESESEGIRGWAPELIYTVVDAARVAADGSVSALWDCDYRMPEIQTERQTRGILEPFTDVWVTHYTNDPSDPQEVAADAETQVDADFEDNADAAYGSDLEFGPGDKPYVLVAREGDDDGTPTETETTPTDTDTTPTDTDTTPTDTDTTPTDTDTTPTDTDTTNTDTVARSTRGLLQGESSAVYRFAAGSLERLDPEGGSEEIAGAPVDLAVDSRGRPVVWTALEDEGDVAPKGFDDATWSISRLQSDLLGLDSTWGDGGTASVTGQGLSQPYAGPADEKFNYLTVRPGDKVFALGSANSEFAARNTPRGDDGTVDGAIIAGFTANGEVDTGFGDSGFKSISYPAPSGENDFSFFQGVGEPRLQTDGKILIPHTTLFGESQIDFRQKIAPPPSEPGYYLGVTRLGVTGQPVPSNPASPSGAAATRPSAVRPSAVPAQCGRRAISLVRADVRGNKIRLTGLVGSKLYGKKVTIETNPTAVKASAYTRTTTVTASKRTGAFSATVRAPKKSQFKTVRYRAKSGGATSPVLKLPQSLTSRSVKSAKGTITVRGQVKRSVLGKRNTVKIRRLACGRYRTVGTARPDADGRYSVTFKASSIRGVAFYRAETRVQVKPGSKKYAIQYARAIAIRTTSQTG